MLVQSLEWTTGLTQLPCI